MANASVQHLASQVVLTPDLYKEHLANENWGFDTTKKLLELVLSMGTKWDDISKVLKIDPSECDKRYHQVIDVLPTTKAARKAVDAGQSDPDAPSKKRRRRTAAEIERGFRCDAPNCSKAYGSEGALKMHVKLKHPGTPATNLPLTQPSISATNGVRPLPLPQPKTPTLSSSGSFPSPQVRASSTSVPPAAPRELEDPKPNQPEPVATHSDIPLLVVSIGKWQKRSLFCGDTMARFSYEERKFVWEIYNLNSLFARMEIPFDNVTELGYELVQENIAKFYVDVSAPPLFYEGIIQAHKPTTWMPIGTDITGGEALPNSRHTLHLLKLSIKQPLEQLIRAEPRFQHILKIGSLSTSPPKPIVKHNAQGCGIHPLSLEVHPSAVHISPSYTISPSRSLIQCTTIAMPVYTDMCPSAVPPLVADTDSPRLSLRSVSSDDEEEATFLYQLDGARRCHCMGGCSTSDCLCFKSLESCGGDCDCESCSNPLNEETAMELCSSNSSTPPSPMVFFPPSHFAPLSPPLSPVLRA